MPDEGAMEADAIGTHLLFEDEQIRVWQIVLEPGQEAPFHTHRCDYTTYTLEGDVVERRNGDGTVDRVTVTPGRVLRWYQSTPRHALRNVGTKTFRNVIFELKHVHANFSDVGDGPGRHPGLGSRENEGNKERG